MNTLNDEELIHLHISQKSDEIGAPSEIEIESEMNRRGLIPKYAQEKFLVKRLDGSQVGPHDILEIKNLFNDGTITADSPVHVQSLFGWAPLRNVFEFEKWSEASSATLTAETMPVSGFQDDTHKSSEQTTSQLQGPGVLKGDSEGTKTDDTARWSEPGSKPKEKGIRRLAFNLSMIGVMLYILWTTQLPFSINLSDQNTQDTLRNIGSISFIVLMFLRAQNIGIRGMSVLVWYFGGVLVLIGAFLFVNSYSKQSGPLIETGSAIAVGIVGLLVIIWLIGPIVSFTFLKTNSFGKNKGQELETATSNGLSPRGFGGWLVLFAVGNVVWYPLFFIIEFFNADMDLRAFRSVISQATGTETVVLEKLFASLSTLFIIGAVEGIAVFLFSIVVIYLLVQEKPIGVLLAKILCGHAILSLLYTTGLAYHMSQEVLMTAESLDVTNPDLIEAIEAFGFPRGYELFRLFGALASGIAWFLYFTYSKRVKATYTRVPEAAESV